MGNTTLGSLCDGIGGFLLCAERVGITPLWLSEIDRDALKVTATRFPNVPNVGDVTKLRNCRKITCNNYRGKTV